MGSLTIPDLDDGLEISLRLRAARHGRSAEEEARAILLGALAVGETDEETVGRPELNLGDLARALFGPLGGVELELPPRGPMREPPDFGDGSTGR